MSALAGIYDPDAERADIERELARMQRALEVPPTRRSAEIASAPGAGCVHLDRRAERGTPCVARDDRGALWLMFVGELYGADELRARSHGAAPDSDAQLCLHLYLQEGADFIRHLNGHFHVVLYHPADRHLSIATDPFGYRPWFLAAAGKRLLFASEMKAILAVWDSTPAVDGIGLLQLARQGWPFGDRTWLEPIQLAAPGAWYEITSRGTQQRRHFRFGYRHRDGALSLSAYVEGFAEKLRRAVQRATAEPARMGLALSGGLDSRALLLAADGGSPNFWHTRSGGHAVATCATPRSSPRLRPSRISTCRTTPAISAGCSRRWSGAAKGCCRSRRPRSRRCTSTTSWRRAPTCCSTDTAVTP